MSQYLKFEDSMCYYLKMIESDFNEFYNKKVCVINFYPLWSSHFGTALEITERLLEHGAKIVFLSCNSSFSYCDSNPNGNKLLCSACKDLSKRGIKKIGENLNSPLLPRFKKMKSFDLLQINSTYKDLLYNQHKTKDIYQGVASSLASEWFKMDILNNKIFDRNLKKINTILSENILLYDFIKNFFISNKIDAVIVFNGRLSHTKTIISAAQNEGVMYFTHERGSDLSKFVFRKNYSVENYESIREEVLKYSLNKTNAFISDQARKFFMDRKKGIIRNWSSFAPENPVNFENNNIQKKVISIYLSSYSENIGVETDTNTYFFENQESACIKILNLLAHKKEYNFIIKFHPNQKNQTINLQEIDKLKKYCIENNISLYDEFSSIDSYDLIAKSFCVITFGSTVGIEAAYWGKPSILLGDALYRGLGSTYEPTSYSEISELLSSDLMPLRKDGAEVFGAWSNDFGISFKYSLEPSLGKFIFKGNNINRSYYMIIYEIFKMIKNFFYR